jgi:NAD(P)-dependent dehydrogenase (short-subunit alcohol dehydrogenase family)
VTALVTGGRGGIGSAIAARFDAPLVLDLPEFDVSDPDSWARVTGEYDVAFLNAGIGIGYPDVAELPEGEYRRIVGANLDGVVFGARECAKRLLPNGGSIVCTASLAGLTAMPSDPIYTLTKHAVVGFVRSAAPQLAERGIRIQAVCPGWADTALTTNGFREELRERGFRLLSPEAVAEGVWAAYKSEGTGEAWVVQPGREPLHYEFKGVPGPR